MERKYYLRGLGIGIAVTAIIMGMIVPRYQKMTDAEIIARAKELGMVENTVLSDLEDDERADEDADEESDEQDDAGQPEDIRTSDQDSTKQDVQPAADDEAAAEDENDSEPADSAEAEQTEAETVSEADDRSEAEDQAAAQDDLNEAITSAAIKTITVNGGDGSYTVARKLADVGVVTSAESFDNFLCQNGYDKRLRTGTFSIPADASDEQIARIVTGAE